MRKILLSCLALSLTSTVAFADLKPGQYAGVRPCRGSSGGVDVDVTSKNTIGVATCKNALSKAFADKGVCAGKKKGAKVEFSFKFGADDDKQQATGTYFVLCK